MTNETLFAAIGDLDETIISETETQFRFQMLPPKKAGLKTAAFALAFAACIALVIIFGMKWTTSNPPDTPPGKLPQLMSDPTTPTKPTPTEPPVIEQRHHITFLHAIGDGSQKKELIENIRFPYRTLIRVRDISDIDDDEFSVVYAEEQKHIENFFNQYPKNALNSWGRYRSDDLLITTLSAGSFILQFDDPSAVESVEISVTDMGHVRLAHSVEGYCCIAGDFLSICLDQNGLQQAIHPSEGGLTMFWQISNQAASMIKENPSRPLSTLQDTITIQICLKDGIEETYHIDMIVDNNGSVYAVYKGTSVAA